MMTTSRLITTPLLRRGRVERLENRRDWWTYVVISLDDGRNWEKRIAVPINRSPRGYMCSFINRIRPGGNIEDVRRLPSGRILRLSQKEIENSIREEDIPYDY